MPFPSHFTHRFEQTPQADNWHPHASSSSRVRARMRVKNHLFVATLVVAVLAGVGVVASRSHAAPTAPDATVKVRGSAWFALGTNLIPPPADGPDQLDALFRTMSRSGVSVVRTALSTADIDLEVRLANKHDLSLVIVDDARAADYTDGTQRASDLAFFQALFTKYRHTPAIIGWELGTGADALVDNGTITPEQLRTTNGALAASLNAVTSSQLAIAQPRDASHIHDWVGLGFDAYDPPSIGTSGPNCLTCIRAGSLTTSQGLDKPVIIGSLPANRGGNFRADLKAAAANGFAGALVESWQGQTYSISKDQARTLRDFAYDTLRAGPLTKPRNPCLGPNAHLFLCPNLVMSKPRDLSLGHRKGRLVLFSTNSLNSVGAGPASIHGVRNGHFTMAGTQLLHRRHGAPLSIHTGAKLLFKAVPGQYRYWKWNGAARMELWRIDSTGKPVELARTGPKTVYCLRDLNRTHGFLHGSPRSRVFPGCNQSLATHQVTLGASVGWTDRYPWTYAENWIDVTGLRGCFAYVHVADPTNAIYESNEDDNRAQVVVKLPFTGSSRGCPGAKALPITGQNGLGY